MVDLFIFAGEPSGDLHGEKLLQALYRQNPNLKIAGVGGPRMRAVGMECLFPMEQFQVMGFVDVFFALPRLIRLFFKVRRAILQLNPKAVVTIDYPGFNLRMAAHLRKQGYQGKLCHYICPSVWAWGKKRIPLMEKNLDLLLTILPFEKQYFSKLKVAYVGHPLIERIPAPSAAVKEKRLIAIFPGSRQRELERNFPLYLEVAKKLLGEFPDISFDISVAHPRFFLWMTAELEKAGLSNNRVRCVPAAENERLMKTAFLGIAKSGTVTLELALYGVPTVVTYALSSFDYFLAKYIFRIRLPYYALPNLIVKRAVFPELIGPAFTPSSLYFHLKQLLNDAESHQLALKGCAEVRERLGPQNANSQAAELILSLLKS